MRMAIRAALLLVAIAPGGAGSQPWPTREPYQLRSAPSPWGPVRSGVDRGPALPWSWLSVEEVRPDGGQESREQLLAWLVAPEDAQRAEALIRLLPSADELLPGLETLASKGNAAERARVLESIQMLTRRRLRLEQLAAYPHLSALVVPSVERGRELVAPWVEVAETEELVEEFRDELCGTGKGPGGYLLIQGARLQRLRDELWTLGGLALPAIEQLLSSPSAPARLHGIVLTRMLDLHPDFATLARLQRDRAVVELATRRIEGFRAPPVAHGRWKVPISQHAERLARALTPQVARRASRTPPVAVDIENRIIEWSSGVQHIGEGEAARQRRALFSDIARALRGAGGRQARDEQAYWNRVRPLWRTWWRVLGPGVDVDDPIRSNLGNSYVGIQSVSEPRDDEQYVLRLAAPAGEKVEILSLNSRNETLAVRRGVLPLELRAVPAAHSMKVRLWDSDEWRELAWRMVRPGESETLWLNPELLRHHREATKETP